MGQSLEIPLEPPSYSLVQFHQLPYDELEFLTLDLAVKALSPAQFQDLEFLHLVHPGEVVVDGRPHHVLGKVKHACHQGIQSLVDHLQPPGETVDRFVMDHGVVVHFSGYDHVGVLGYRHAQPKDTTSTQGVKLPEVDLTCLLPPLNRPWSVLGHSKDVSVQFLNDLSQGVPLRVEANEGEEGQCASQAKRETLDDSVRG